MMERARIEKLVPGGQGMATLGDGKRTFVWGVLPGELVEFEVTRSKRSYSEGVVSKVIEAAAQRIGARDECYLATSPWQVFDYDYELGQKARLVEECFRQQHVAVAAPTTEDGEQKARIADGRRVAAASFLMRAGEKNDAPPVIAGDDNVPPVKADGKGVPPVKTDGKDFYYRNKMEYSLYWDNAESLIELAFHARGSHRKLPITGSSIERPEILTQAREMVAERNAAGTGAQAILAKSENVLECVTPDTTVILDPPRAGCDAALVARLNEVVVPKIIYLSCNPITQARDVAALLEKYKIEYLQPYNFFPRTPHIENLAVLSHNYSYDHS